jgi:hypothetical protein
MYIPCDLIKLLPDPTAVWGYGQDRCYAQTVRGETVQVVCSPADQLYGFKALRKKIQENDYHVLYLSTSNGDVLTTVNDGDSVIDQLLTEQNHRIARMQAVAENHDTMMWVGRRFLTKPRSINDACWQQFVWNRRGQPGQPFLSPLLAESLNDFLSAPGRYYPLPGDPSEKASWRNLSCYVAQPPFPKNYCTEITLHPSNSLLREKKCVKLILHSFSGPSRLHSHFWSHVIGVTGCPKRTAGWPAEPDEWAGFFAEVQLPTDEQLRRKKCDYQGKGCSSWLCNKNKTQFPKVHAMLAPGLQKYLDMAVAFFEGATTKKLYMWEIKGGLWGLDIGIGGSVIKNPDNPSAKGYCDFMCLHGYCFNWHAPTPVIHCRIMTYYHRPEGQPFWRWNRARHCNERKGSLYNVRVS